MSGKHAKAFSCGGDGDIGHVASIGNRPHYARGSVFPWPTRILSAPGVRLARPWFFVSKAPRFEGVVPMKPSESEESANRSAWNGS